VAPDPLSREYIQKTRDLSPDDAQKVMISTDANRSAFVKRYFNSDANDPANYDLILNTGTLSVDKAVQIFGGYGLMKEYDVERFYRDYKLLTIGEGTSEIQRLVIARKIGCYDV
jgi:hypothetical protein